MCINTISICFIIFPLSIENISIYVIKLSMSTSLIISPLSFVFSTILPFLHTESISLVSLPISFIDSSTFKFIGSSFFSFLIGIIIFSYFWVIKIFLISSTNLLIKRLSFFLIDLFSCLKTFPSSLNVNSCLILLNKIIRLFHLIIQLLFWIINLLNARTMWRNNLAEIVVIIFLNRILEIK